MIIIDEPVIVVSCSSSLHQLQDLALSGSVDLYLGWLIVSFEECYSLSCACTTRQLTNSTLLKQIDLSKLQL